MNKSATSWFTFRARLIPALPAILIGGFTTPDARAIELGHIDDFQDQTTMNWQHGAQNAHAPRLAANEGPDGAGDHALRVSSSGGIGPGGRMVMFNRSQWTGDFIAAGVTTIRFELRHVSGSNASIRVAFADATAPGGTWFVSSDPISITSGTSWDTYELSLQPDDLVRVAGSGSAEDVLANVAEFRLLSSGSPDFRGDVVTMELLFDNIEAVGTVETTPFDAWRSIHFPDELENDAISGPLADPDADGIPNFLEFVLAGDPLSPNTIIPPFVSTVTDDENGSEATFLAITVTRRNDLGSVVFEVQTANEIGAWTPGGVLVNSTENDGTVTEVWRDDVPIGTSNARFIRVVAKQE